MEKTKKAWLVASGAYRHVVYVDVCGRLDKHGTSPCSMHWSRISSPCVAAPYFRNHHGDGRMRPTSVAPSLCDFTNLSPTPCIWYPQVPTHLPPPRSVSTTRHAGSLLPLAFTLFCSGCLFGRGHRRSQSDVIVVTDWGPCQVFLLHKLTQIRTPPPPPFSPTRVHP